MTKNQDKIIGIVGGVGPYAGADLFRKICSQTRAETDQEHLEVVMISDPSHINDRSVYLEKGGGRNPGDAIGDIILRLAAAGAEVVGIPCNTAHSPAIVAAVESKVIASGVMVEIVHMIREVAEAMRRTPTRPKRMGLLATTGTYHSKVYSEILGPEGFEVIVPEVFTQKDVHRAIYDPKFGIKAQGHPISTEAKGILEGASRELLELGAEKIILGCTELPLAFPDESDIYVDPTLILARALIREAAPEKLKPL